MSSGSRISRGCHRDLTGGQVLRNWIGYRVYPGLNGKTKGGAPPPGVVDVTISGEPVPARVGDASNVVRGEETER